MPGPEDYSLLADLYNTLVRYATRFLVQRQVFAILFVLIGAGLVARILVHWGERRYVAWCWRQRRLMRGASGRRKWRQRTMRSLAIVLQQITFPLLALGAVLFADAQFARLGWLNGLLKWAELILFLYVFYRLLIAVLFVLARRKTAQHYQRRLLRPLMLVGILLLILSRLADLELLGQVVLFRLFGNAVTISALLIATVGLYFWIMAAFGLQRLLTHLIVDSTEAHAGRVEASFTIMRYILIGLGVYFAMSTLGFDPTTVAAITGGLSIGIGFALQDVLKNFFGGLVILFEGTVRPGDYVEVGGKEAVVQQLNIRSTRVRTADNVEIIVPNQDWLVRPVITYTGSSNSVRLRFPVSVKREVEVGQVVQLLTSTVRKHPLVLEDPSPGVSITNFNGANVDYVLTAWVADAAKMSRVQSDIRLMLLHAFENTEIALA